MQGEEEKLLFVEEDCLIVTSGLAENSIKMIPKTTTQPFVHKLRI